jgi:cytidylate kinase
MNRVENIERYLRAHLAAERTKSSDLDSPHAKSFVTISRESGTGGHALADVMIDVFSGEDDAELLGGWQVYDRTVCEIVARDPRFERSLESLVEEEYRSRTDDFIHQLVRSTAGQMEVMERVFLVVRSIAGMGKAIVVGRGGSHVTMGMPHGVSVRMVAPERQRIARTMETRDLPERDARAYVRKHDIDRARLIRAHFDADIADPLGYDLTCNRASMSYEEIARATMALVRARAVAHEGIVEAS